MSPILKTMNAANCGDTRLALGVEREVSLTGCLPLGTPSVVEYRQEYDLLSLEHGKLFTGLRGQQMNLEANRPSQLFAFS